LLLYALTCASIVWLLGVWALAAGVPVSLQLRSWGFAIATAGLHALMAAVVGYWMFYGRNQLDRYTAGFFGLMMLGGSLSGLLYFVSLRYFQKDAASFL
jgi:hypothetical protein